MKQAITQDQFEELSVLNQLKARAIFDPLGHPSEPDPLLTVGRMIEFLMTTHYYRKQHWLELGGIDHAIDDRNVGFADNVFGIGWKGDGLCDSLWEMVKAVLEQPTGADID